MTPVNKQGLAAATWGLLQLIILALGASGFAMWSHHPLPRQSLALEELLCGQMLIAGLLAPALFPGTWGIAIGLGLSLAMDELAGLLSSCPQIAVATSFIILATWVVLLKAILAFCHSDVGTTLVTAAATLFLIGGTLLDYLRLEAASSGERILPPLGPLSEICLLIKQDRMPASVILGCCVIIFLSAFLTYFYSKNI